MGLFSEPLDQVAPDALGFYRTVEEPELDPTLQESVGAAFESRGFLPAIDRLLSPPPGMTEAEEMRYLTNQFDPGAYARENHPNFDSDRHYLRILEMETPARVDWLVNNITEEEANNEILRQSPWYQSVPFEFAAELLTPWELLTYGALPAKAGKAAIMFGGKSAAALAAHEATLHASKELNTWQESAFIVATGGLLGGSFAGFLANRSRRAFEEQLAIENLLTDEAISGAAKLPPQITGEAAAETADATGAGTSVGAAMAERDLTQAQVDNILNDPELTEAQKQVALWEARGEPHTLLHPQVVKWSGLGFMQRLLPQVRGMMSTNPVMRRWAFEFYNSNLQNRAQSRWMRRTSLEAKQTSREDALHWNIHAHITDGYKSYKEAMRKAGVIRNSMPKADFHRQVHLAMTRGDVADNAVVQETATKIRGEFSDLVERAKREGLLDDDAPLGDVSWFLRQYSRDGIAQVSRRVFISEEGAMFKGMMKRIAQETLDEYEAKAVEIEKKTAEQLAKMNDPKKGKRFKRNTPERRKQVQESGKAKAKKWRTKAKDDIQKQLGGMYDQIVHGKGFEGGSFIGLGAMRAADGTVQVTKARTLDIATEDIPDQFLHSDPVSSLVHHLVRMERIVSAAEDGRFGDVGFSKIFDDMAEYYDAKMEAFDETITDPAELAAAKAKFAKEYKSDLQDLKDAANRNAMTYQHGMRKDVVDAARAMKMLSVSTKLGRVLFSAAPEAFSVIRDTSASAFVRTGMDLMTNSNEFRSLTMKDRVALKRAMESMLNARYTELPDHDFSERKWLANLQKGTDQFVDKVIGLGVWTRTMRSGASAVIETHIGDLAMKKVLTDRDIMDLSGFGITRDMWPAVKEQIMRHHQVGDWGSINLRMVKWDNKELMEEVNSGISAAAFNNVVRPGQGLRPYAFDNPIMSVLMQFKGFPFAATEKYLMANAQRIAGRDVRPLMNMLLMGTVAANATYLRQLTLPEHKQREWDWDDFVREGLIMSGTMGFIGDINTFIAAGTGGGVDAFRLLGMDPKVLTKYRGTQTTMGFMFGPSVSLTGDFVNTGNMLYKLFSGNELTQGDINAAVRLIPGNNLHILARPISEARDRLAEEIIE